MALIFPRLAKNFIKNGYYPTDEVTMQRICSALDTVSSAVRVFDPCCGEGTAVSMINEHLTEAGTNVEPYGVEIDAERAWHAKQLLKVVAHSDLHDMMIAPQTFGLLFMNPPYGDIIADQANLGERQKRDRHELVFCRKTFGLLQNEGVLVLVIPYTIIDEEFSNLIARNFKRVSIWLAPEQQFKQTVIFGVKRRSQNPDQATVEQIMRFKTVLESRQTLPEHWMDESYDVPGIDDARFSFVQNTIDGAQLEAEVEKMRSGSLWPRFTLMFQQSCQSSRSPLMPPSKWHQALMLAAGQVSGKVVSNDGRTLLIKGDTFKKKERRTEVETRENGDVTETVILTDRFVPIIRAIDFTPGENLGRVITIG